VKRWIDFSPKAQSDLDHIAAHIALDDPDAAHRVVLRILDAVELLVDYPHMGSVHGQHATPIRRLVVRTNPYVVYYHAHEDRIEVAHVLHGRQDAGRILRESQR
jgi:toxin ParE1/3/4